MDTNSRDQMIASHIDNAVTDLIPHGAGTVTEHRLRHILNRVAQQTAQTSKNYELLNLLDTAEIAELWGVSTRRVRAHCAHLHDRWGVGRKANGGWLMTRAEAENHRPGNAGRPPAE